MNTTLRVWKPVPNVAVEDNSGFTPGIHCADNRLGLWRVIKVNADGIKHTSEVLMKHDPETGMYRIRPAAGPSTWSRPMANRDEAQHRATCLLKAVVEANEGLVTFEEMLHEWHELMFN